MLQRKLGRVAAGPLVPPLISSVLNRKGQKVRSKKIKGGLKISPGGVISTSGITPG